MKIQKKSKTQSALERRNTSIGVFVLVALIPLFLALLTGFSMGKAESVNLENQTEEMQKLKKENTDIKQYVISLNNLFLKADTLLDDFREEEMRTLEKEIDNARSDLHFEDFSSSLSKKFSDFNRNILYEFNLPPNPVLKDDISLLAVGEDWIKDLRDAQNKELVMRRVIRKHNLEEDIVQEEVVDYSDEIEFYKEEEGKLKEEKGEYKEELKGKSRDIEKLKEEIEELEEELRTLQYSYGRLLDKNERVKSDIEDEIKEIREDLLPYLNKKFANNFEANKLKLNGKINRIADKLLEMTVE